MKSDVFKHRIWLALGFLAVAAVIVFSSRNTFFDGFAVAWLLIGAFAQGVDWVSEQIAPGPEVRP